MDLDINFESFGDAYADDDGECTKFLLFYHTVSLMLYTTL